MTASKLIELLAVHIAAAGDVEVVMSSGTGNIIRGQPLQHPVLRCWLDEDHEIIVLGTS